MKSNIWLKRQNKDLYVKKSKSRGYVSRSAFKLIQIENKYQLITKSKNVLEIGSAPGGWSQVICQINKYSKLDCFDLIKMKFVNVNINFFLHDFFKFNIKSLNKRYDLILSDVAPNSTGHKSTDHLKITSMIHDIIDLLEFIAFPKSNFVFKILKGTEEKNILQRLNKLYKKVSYYKPTSSRIESSEIFIVAENFIG